VKKINIKIDYREKPSGVINLLDSEAVAYSVEKLKYGDYVYI
jgi:ERCC4-type nuclease